MHGMYDMGTILCVDMLDSLRGSSVNIGATQRVALIAQWLERELKTVGIPVGKDPLGQKQTKKHWSDPKSISVPSTARRTCTHREA